MKIMATAKNLNRNLLTIHTLKLQISHNSHVFICDLVRNHFFKY